MFTIINSLPLWLRLTVLVVGEVLLIYSLIKKKVDNNKIFKSFVWMLVILAPAIAVGMFIDNNVDSENGKIFSRWFSLAIGFIFVVGLVIVSILMLKSGKVSNEQRNILLTSLFILLLCLIAAVVITILEKCFGF